MALAVTPDRVRGLLNPTLTSEQLSNDTVNQDDYATRAVLEVKRRDPLWASRSGDDETRLNIAANNLCAAYIARKMPWLVGEDEEGIGGYRAQQTDVDALIAELLATASEMVGAVVDEEGSERPTAFTLAHGTRGL